MEKKLLKRLIALVLSGGVLISSTGVYTALAASEETTTSEYTSALVGSEETTTKVPETTTDETTVPSTTVPTTSVTTEVESTTENVTETTTADVQKPATTQKPESTTKLPVVEEIVETPSNNGLSWVGVDGTEANAGTQENPYDVSSIEHFLAMNGVLNDVGNANKYFRLTANLDFTGYTIDSTVISAQGQTGMEGSLVSVNPSLSSSNVFFHFDGNNKSIKNITIENGEYSSLSIFGYVNSASTIENLTVDTVSIKNTYSDAQAVGVILKNDGIVKDCIFTVVNLDTTASSTKAESFYPTDDASIRVYSGTAIVVDNGGIIDGETGYDSSTTIVNVENVTINTSRPYAGALVAQNRGKINKVRGVYLTVKGSSTNSDYVGGLVGTNMTARTSSSTGIYYAEIKTDGRSTSVTGADKIGFLAGYNTGRIQRCTVVGSYKSNEKATANKYDILVSGGKTAGGIVGENAGDVQLCTARNIGVYFADSSDGTIYGGIAGKTTYGVRNCIATGSTAGDGTAHEITRYIGGIVGYGDTSSNFSVENCYALVKIIDSNVPLGAVVGYNGDTAYKNNKVRNVFYSGIISSRPSPVSYGGAGETEGDLSFSKAYAIAYYTSLDSNTVSVTASDFGFSGWGDASFAVDGNFRISEATTSSYTPTGVGTNSFTYQLNSAAKSDKTVVNYDVNITLPTGIGASKEATVLEDEPMEFGILNSQHNTATGSGTKDSPFSLFYKDINFLYYAPAAHFIASTDGAATTWSTGNYTAPSATFWGSIDFNNTITVKYNQNATPLFEGIYGSRDDSLGNNSVENHKSSSDDNSDTASNLANGVVKNVTFEIGVTNISAIMGNICNATVKNVSVTFSQDNIAVTATESNTGLFAKSVYGNSYIYGCYIDSTQSNQYKTSTFDGVSGFIGTVDAEKTIIDNCGVNLIIASEKSGATNCAVFIGRIKSLSGGYIQNCYASGGLINSGGTFNSSSSYIFAGSIDSSSTQIYNCYFSPSYYYTNNKGISLGVKSGSYTGSCKAWSFIQMNDSTQVWGDITIKVTASQDTAYLATINNLDRFPVSTYEANPLNLNNYFAVEASAIGTATLTPDSRFSWDGRVGIGYTFTGDSGASATLWVTHNATGLVAKLTVFNSSDLGIDDEGYFLIKTPVDLYYLSTNQLKLNPGSTDHMYLSSTSKIKLAADIDMTGHTIEPIGQSVAFKGEFVAGKPVDEDGNPIGDYYKISNLTFNQDNLDQALFGNVQGATIKGIHIDNANINCNKHYTAALIGTIQDYALVEDCKVTNSTISGGNHVGAIIGGIQKKDDAEGSKITEIKNCTVENTTVTSVKAEKEHAYIGGIIGGIDADNQNNTRAAQISGCKVTNCEISSMAYGIGGIVGYAPNNKNTITSCTVTGTNLTCNGTNGATYASLGGIAGLYGGSSISSCTVVDSVITGECAAGIVTRLANETGSTSTISGCTVTNTTVTSDNIAGGILAQVSAFATSSCLGEKIIDGCKVSADTTVKSLVAGGIVGNIQQFNNGSLTISDCTNLGTVETTGKKGSQIDGAGGVIGRISSGMGTSGVLVTGCLSNGTLKGNSNLGGIIGTNLANTHTGTNDLIKDSYVTGALEFSSKNLAVSKGIIIGFVGSGNRDNVSVLAENVVYSSLDTKEPLYGNVDATAQTGGGFDMNLGSDKKSGITIGLAKTLLTSGGKRRRLAYTLQAIEGYEDNDTLGTTNVIELKTNFYLDSAEYEGNDLNKISHSYGGTTYSVSPAALTEDSIPCLSVGNLPALTGTDGNAFVMPSENVFSTSANESKIIVGCGDYNTCDDIAIQTFDKKCQAVVKTTYTGVINGETVTFDVGFTVIVNGTHAFDGTGTEKDPFEIYTAEDLLAIKQHRDGRYDKDDYADNLGYYYEAYYRVHNDIDMTEELQEKSFAPIGTSSDPFRGHIYSRTGNQFTISNMLINSPEIVTDYAYGTENDSEEIYSDAFGVFGYTNGAEISDLRFENVTYSSVASANNEFLGIKTGSVIGVAENTTIHNVEVTGTVNIEINGSYGGRAGAIGGIVGEARNNVVLTDVAVKGEFIGGTDEDGRVSINLKGFYQVGGIVGSSADTTGVSITNAVVENADIVNLATSGTGIAGGIAGQYSGIITGSSVADDEGNITETRVKVNNVVVTGIVAGGVVGSGSINNTSSGEYDLTVKMTDVTGTNIEVTSALRNDAQTGSNGVAGGIIGESRESYHYLIEDCNVDSTTAVISGYCAGGIVGKAMNNGSGSFQAETSLFIKNCSSQANVQQLNVVISEYSGVSDDVKRVTGVGSVIGVLAQDANVMNKETSAPQIQITDTIAGGTVSGTFNVGGIIGEFATVQPKLNEMTGPIIYDCVVTAKIAVPLNMTASERFGVVLGSIEGNQFNENNPNEQDPTVQVPFPDQDSHDNTIKYASRIFDKIFYSSYTAGSYALYGISIVKNYSVPQDWNHEEDGFAAAEALSVYTDEDNGVYQTIYDVNQVMYNFKVTDQNNITTETKLPVSVVMDNVGDAADPTKYYQWFGAGEYQFSDEFISLLEANNGSGDPFGFTIAGKEFTLAEDGVQSADTTVFKVIPNPDSSYVDITEKPYKITVEQFNTADLVFTYTNGLQIGLPIICGVNFEGDGTSDNPIKVANEDIFYYIVRVLPTYSFVQTADLDFTKEDAAGNPKYPVTSSSQLLANFTGVYDGGDHTITGLTANIDSSTTPVGIFGKVSGQHLDDEGNVIPNVKDLTFINCTVNSGDTSAGTGVFAGAVTDGATISNVKVQNSTATSNLGTVGGIAGAVSGSTTLENVEVTGGTVTATNGSAGGVIGTITEDTVTVIAPKVADTIVTSGSTSGDTFSGGANAEDIAGGIVAQALGTITGPEPTTDADNNIIYTNAVEKVTVKAFIAGGAVGAVYKDISASSFDTEYALSMNDIRVAETNVVANTSDTTRTGISGAGLLALARCKTAIALNNCYVTKTTTASSVASNGIHAYGAGAVAQVTHDVTKLDIIDTESYATVSVTEADKDGTVYAAGLVGYISSTEDKQFDLNNLRFDGSVAGGEISGKAMTTYVAGVIGGLNEYITSEIAGEFFVNGVVSATVENIDGGSANITNEPVHRFGKFIAGYNDGVFVADNFATLFKDNYYSTYPQNVSFFSSESGESAYENALTEEMFKDINVQGNLIIADEYESSWNSVAITKNIGTETLLYAKLDIYSELPYGSKDENGEFTKVAVAAGGFSLEAIDSDCIELISILEDEGRFQLTVKPTDYGAEVLVAEYTCGLKTTGTIISVEIKGTGKESDPYLISTPTQLRVVGYLAKGNNYFRQINDIDLSNSYNTGGTDTDKFIHYNGGKFYSPIGSDKAAFDGVYDGQGYKITGLKAKRSGEDNIGLFGVVAQNGDSVVPTIKNVHLELMPSDTSNANGIVGGTNVGGIVGKISNGLVENCSVTIGSVTGKNYVGGIAGNFTDSKIINCFTQSDVNAFGDSKPYSGGIAGYVTSAGNGSEISGCFASGSIYATPTSTSNDKSNSAGIVGYTENATDFKIDNCLFTGTTASGYGITAGNGSLNISYSITDCIDAGQNIAMASDIFSRIETAVAPSTTLVSQTISKSGVYYDNALLKTNVTDHPDSTTGVTGLPTSKLINTISVSLGDGWNLSTGYYPVPDVSEITVTTYSEDGTVVETVTKTDPYSEAYARFLSAPVITSESEECSDIDDPSFAYGKGLVYPVTLLTKVDENKVIYSSSIFDTTDTVAYPEGFDTKLYGVPVLDEEGNVTYDDNGNVISNKNVDLLFEDKDTGYTTVYRNIFDTTKGIASKANFESIPSKNTYVNTGAASGNVFTNGEAYYNAQVPVIFATAEINGISVQRDIKIPLSQGSTYCIATQRQLYALGKAEYELVANTKFSDYYDSTYNYKLITDINCGDNETLFTPIGSDVDSGYTGQFDGSGHKIINLKIKSEGLNYVGMFSKISKDYDRNVDPFVKNLTLENATVEALSVTSGGNKTGGDYVGTLVGHVFGEYVTVENCHAIGSVEYETDAETGDILVDKVTGEPVVKAYHGTVNGEGSYVGGLIGKVDYPSDNIISCSASVAVTGSKDAVGGLIGDSAGTVESCYATGNVICDELTNGNTCGVGGLIGIMSNGTVAQSFASGNVEVKAFNTDDRYNQVTNGQFGIGGFVGYVAEMQTYNSETKEYEDVTGDVITECFSGGNVAFGTANDTSNIKPNSAEAIVGVGGFSGINRESIAHGYSSAAVRATFGNIYNINNISTYGVGVGGIAGVALAGVSDVYSSGSVAPAYTSRDTTQGTCYYGVGGTVGTRMNSGATCQYCYYDSWTNTDPNLTSIGDRADDNTARSLPTTELTRGKKPSIGTWSDVWDYTPSAYPYLKNLLNEEADPYIKTNSILSVVCVNVADDDVSAKTGAGVTQALTVPSEFKYTDDKGDTITYNLDWAGATLEGNLAAINRTQNVREYVDVVAQVRDYEKYATRTYSRLCADMKGTFEQPYLIGNETDLAHVNMTTDELSVAIANYNGFYDQWATPLGDGGEQVEGRVHYQLMSNVSVTNVRKIPAAPSSYTYSVKDIDESGNETTIDKTFNYQGFMLKGNGYSIKDVNTTGYYFGNVDANSTISNIIFENFTFTGGDSAIVGTNDGQLVDVFVKSTMNDASENVAGLVQTNKGTIDGCLVDATINGVASNVGVMAVNNSGTILNSGTAGSITTSDGNTVNNVAAFVATNTSSISNSFSMADIDVLAEAGADVQLVSGFVAINSGTIDGVYTRSALSFANGPQPATTIASLVGELTNADANAVTNSYAAGLLGYYNETQDSILFGTVPEGHTKLSSVYVDKSLAGENSANSYKYSASLSSMMSMQYMADTMKYDATNNPDGKFVAGEQTELVLPQLASILNAENNMVVDEDGNLIYVDTKTNTTYTLFTENDEEGNAVRKYKCSDGNTYYADEVDNVVDENGTEIIKFNELKLQYSVLLESKTIIRNYDVIKAYSKISSMALKTAQSQYADRLAPNSSDADTHGAVLNSQVSTTADVQFAPVNNIIGINNATRKLWTNNTAGGDSIRVNYNTSIELSRGMKINPELLIDVAVSQAALRQLNPNFSSGIGTADKPYVINNAASLQTLHYYGTESDLYFVLGNDIDMSGIDDFQIHVFTAHLNAPESLGDDTHQYAIENFTSTKGEGGLFGRIESGAVVNNVALTGTVSGSEQYTGALANVIDGATVTNCVVSAEVTSTAQADEYSTPATGVLAGRVTNTSQVSGIVTTGNVTATAGPVGGVIGSAQQVTISEILSTANVGEGEAVAGIIGEMLEGATLTNALYGGVAESKKPIVGAYVNEEAITETYFDKQLNKGIEEGTVIGTAKTTKECEALTFSDTFVCVDENGGYYSVPATIVNTIDVSGATSYVGYGSTAALAAATMNFYLGSTRGEIGFYTSMQFVSNASGTAIEVTEKNDGNKYFEIGTSEDGTTYVVKCLRYNDEAKPSVVLTLDNGAIRTICPGLVKNANVKYRIVTENGTVIDDINGKTLGVLLKSASDGDNVYVLNDFTDKINGSEEEMHMLDSFVVEDEVNGFYLYGMIPSGYEYEVSSILLNDNVNIINGVEVDEDTGVSFINLDFDSFDYEFIGENQTLDTEKTEIKITLKIVESNKPWGVNSVKNILW